MPGTSPSPEVIADLRARIQRLQAGGAAPRPVLHFGVKAIDAVLPGGGLAAGALHEVAGGGNGAIDGAVAALFAAGIAGRTKGKVLWCVVRQDLFAPALAQVGLSPSRVIFVEAGDEKTALASFEEGLRHRGLGAVVAELARLPMNASRRLQLAAEQGGAIGIAIRRWRRQTEASDFGQPTAYKSYSRGRLRLRSASPAEQPRIDFAMLLDPRDLARMADGLSLMIGLLDDPGIAALTSGVFVPAFSRTMRRLSRPGHGNAAAAALLSAAVDLCPPLGRRILHLAGEDPRSLTGRDTIEDFARRRSIAMFHPAGTCRMGAAGDPHAVVDPHCRVLGVAGLHVADAAIMPTIPRANTFLPVTMIAERAATLIRAALRG